MMVDEYDMEDLLDATRYVESRGNRFAIGPPTKYGRAKGPYQFIDDTAREFGVHDPFDEAQARAGARVKMGGLLKAYGGDTRTALAAWNWGEGKLAQHGMENAPKETRDFVQKVINRLPPKGSYPGEPPRSVVPAGGLFPSEIKSTYTDTLFPESRESDQLRETLMRSRSYTPDKAARMLRMQLRTGLPAGFIERNLDEIEQKAKREDFDADKFRQNNPKLATWLAENPAHAAIAANDLDNLSFLEKSWATMQAVPYGLESGVKTQDLLGRLNYRKTTGEITPQEEIERQKLNQTVKERSLKFSTGAPSWTKGAAEVVGLQVQPLMDAAREAALGGLGGAAVGTLIAGPAGTAPGTFTGMRVAGLASLTKSFYELSVGEAYGDLEDAKDANGNPLDPTVIRYAAMLAGVPNTALEALSLGATIRVIPGAQKLLGQFTAGSMKQLLAKPAMTAALKDFGGKYATAVGTEAFTEGLQKFVNIVTREMVAGEDRTGITGQDMQAVGAEAVAAAKATAVLFALGAPIKIMETRADIARSQRDEAFMTALGDVAANSETAAKSPDAMRAYIEALKADGPVQNVYIPRQSWDAIFADKAQAVAAEVFGSDSTQYAESGVTGDLVIPIETYTQKLAGTQFHAALMPDLRLEPASLSPREREAAIVAEPEVLAQLQADAQLAAEKEAPVTQVFEDVRSKLLQTGADEASAYRDAKLETERVRARAERLGVDPWALYQEKPLMVQREVTPEIEAKVQQFTQRLAEPPVPTQPRLPMPMGEEISLPAITATELRATDQALQAMERSQREAGVIGATISPTQGNRAGKSGVAVTGYPQRGVVTDATPTQAEIDKFLRFNRDIFAQDKDANLGVWVDTETGKGYLDITLVLPREEAIEIGERFGEIAVFDLEAMDEIRLPVSHAAEMGQRVLLQRATYSRHELENLANQGAQMVLPGMSGEARLPPKIRTVQGVTTISEGRATMTAQRGEVSLYVDDHSTPQPVQKAVKAPVLQILDADLTGERRRDTLQRLLSAAIDFAEKNELDGVTVPSGWIDQYAGAIGYEALRRQYQDIPYRDSLALMSTHPRTEEARAYLDKIGIPPALGKSSVLPAPAQVSPAFFNLMKDKFNVREKISRLYVERTGAPFIALSPDERRIVAATFETFADLGVPQLLPELVSVFGKAAFPERGVIAQANVVTRGVLMSGNGLRELSGANRAGAVQTLLHELGHLASIGNSGRSPLFTSPFMDAAKNDAMIVTRSANGLIFEPSPRMGDVLAEALSLGVSAITIDPFSQLIGVNSASPLIARLLTYPAIDVVTRRMAPERVQAEVFAQIWSAFFVYPEELKKNAPESYDFINGILDVVRPATNLTEWARLFGSAVEGGIDYGYSLAPIPLSAENQGVLDHANPGPLEVPGKAPDFRTMDIRGVEPLQAPGTVAYSSPDVLYQAPRGMFAPQSKLITLLKDANPSTFLHELGHSWLEELRADAMRDDAPVQIRQDWNTVREWIGATDSYVPESAHEKFARGVEVFVMEGRTPSEQLREVFARLKDWLGRIYKSMDMLDVELTPEVRDVMDRLLATDEAIKQAHEYNEYHHPLLDPSMLTPEEYARYQELNEAAKTEAETTLRAQVMRELRREHMAEWRKRRDAVTRTVMAEIDAQPVYRALYWLSHGTMPDGKGIPGLEHARLSRSVLESLGIDPEILPKRVPPIIQKEGGLHPDVVAEVFGFASGRDFITELVSATSRTEAVETQVAERMRETYGDLLLDASLPERAAVEIQNTRQIEVFNMELRLLKRLGTTRTEVRPAVLKDLAKRMIADKRVGDLDPRQFEAAAIQAGQEAEAALLGREFRQGLGRNLDAAFDAKQRQMLNVMLYREAVEQKREIDRSMRQWKRLFKADTRLSKTRNMDLVNAARAVAAHRGIIAGQETAGEYMRALATYDPQTYEDMKDLVDTATSDNRGWEDLSVAEFASVRDTINGLWKLSRRTRMSEIEGKLVDRQLITDALAGRIRTLTGNAPERKGYHEAMTPWEKTKMGLLGLRASGRRIEPWVNTMDGGDFKGAFRRYIWQPISDAANAYRDARRQYLKKYAELVRPYGKHLPVGKITSPPGELDYTFTSKAELIGALLHTGNESNMQKLLRGREWGAFNAANEIDTTRWDAFIKRMWDEKVLTRTDYEFVQGVWDLLDTLKPQAQAAHRDMYGYYFSEVTAQAVQTPWGEFKGGYFPAAVDSFLSEDAALRADKAATEDAPSSFLFPTTGRGFTRQRVEAYARPLSLDLGLVPQHIQKVLRFIYLEPHIKDVGRVAIDRQFRAALTGLDTEFASTALIPWLQRAAKQIVDTPSTGRAGRMADSFFRELRSRTGLQIMFANVTNTFLQFTGLSLVLLKVNPRYLAGALWRYTRSPSAYAQQVSERSVFMRNRTSSQVIEITQEIDNILLNPSKYEKAQAFARQHGYFMQTATQNIVDLISWGGAYEEALAGSSNEIEAVRVADSTVRETQGTFAAEDLSRIETLSPFLRLFTMFYSYFNMQANLLGTEFVKAARRGGFAGASRAFYVYVFGFMVPAMLSEMLAQAMSGALFDDDDDDGYLDNLLSAFFTGQVKAAAGMVPGVGPVAMAGINMFNDKWYDDRISTSPVVSTLESAGRAPYDIYKVASGEGEARLKRPIQDTLTALSLVTGLPFAALGRPAGYLADVEQGYVEPEGPVDTARGLISGKASK